MQSIFSYSDFRVFLRDFYEEKKKTREYSYKYFSEKAGLNSPNYFALVMSGVRDLTVANIHQFAPALDLRSDEVEFFETLVLLNQAKTTEEKSYYESRRKKLLKHRPVTASKQTPASTLSAWYYTSILVLAHGKTNSEAIVEAKKQLGLSSAEVTECLNTLTEIGLLKAAEDQRLQISSQQVTFHDSKSISKAQEKFLHSQIQQSLKAFHKTYSKKSGKFLSHTLTVPPGALKNLSDKFLGMLEELTAEMDSQIDSSSELAQINIQIFKPLNFENDQ